MENELAFVKTIDAKTTFRKQISIIYSIKYDKLKFSLALLYSVKYI